MAGVRRKPRGNDGVFQGWFVDWSGKRRFFRGTGDRKQTLAIARKLEDENREITLGYRPAPKISDKPRKYLDTAEEYCSWGEAQGGLGGRPWGAKHARERRAKLAWWMNRLGLVTLADIAGILPRVEKMLRELSETRSGKTVANYAETLTAFCGWCVTRGYLETDPLSALRAFDTTPKTRRRAMSPKEIERLLAKCRPDFRLLYETALVTGLRANELRNLETRHLDTRRCGLQLEAKWTKGRRSAFQPLPRDLAQRLENSAKNGQARRLYAATERRRRKSSIHIPPEQPLLYVPSHPGRELYIDLKLAEIAKWTPEGKLDFHALRTSFCTLIIESGANLKEAMSLMRHVTPDLTANAYARTRLDRLHGLTENVGEKLKKGKKCVSSVSVAVAGAKEHPHIFKQNRQLASDEQWWRRRESNPRPKI